MIKNKGFISILATLVLALGSLVALGTYVDSDQYKARVGDGVNTISPLPGKVKVSSNDTTIGFLGSKLAAGDNISIVETNDGGNETLTISSSGGGGGGGTWGSIVGTLSDQTDLQSALDAKQDDITTGTTAQYFRGDLSLATFPTLLSSFTNDSGFITGLNWGDIGPTNANQILADGGSIGDESGNKTLVFHTSPNEGQLWFEMTGGDQSTPIWPKINVTSESIENVGMDLQAKGDASINILGTGDYSGQVRWYERGTDTSVEYFGIRSPDDISSSYILSFPTDPPGGSGEDELLQSDSSGILSWIAPTSLPFVRTSEDQSVDGIKTFSSNIKTSAGDCVDSDEYCQKAYIDSFVQGLAPKQSVRVATTVAGTLATSFENGDTVDGVVLATGNRILIKNQAASSANGIYTVNASGAPTRATDYDAAGEINQGTFVTVLAGSQINTIWVMYEADVVTVNTDPINFSQLSQPNSYNFDVGTTGSDFNVDVSGFDITYNLPTASASNRGALSSADWSNFDAKIDGAGTVVDNRLVTWDGTSGSAVQDATNLTALAGTITAGESFILQGFDSSGVDDAGDLSLLSGDAVLDTGGDGGTITLLAGNGTTAGEINITAGNAQDELQPFTSGGAVNITGGASNSSLGFGGPVNITGGGTVASQGGGSVNLTAAPGSLQGGDINLYSGQGPTSGNVYIYGASKIENSGDLGGSINLTAGNSNDTGGNILLTSGTSVAGAGGSIGLVASTGSTSNGGIALSVDGAVYAVADDASYGPALIRAETNGSASPFVIKGASGNGAFTPGGTVSIYGGEVDDTDSFQTGGGINLYAGNGNTSAGSEGGSIELKAGSSTGISGGDVTIQSGEVTNFGPTGGDIILKIGGSTDGNATNGSLKIQSYDIPNLTYRTVTMDFNALTADRTVTWQDAPGTVAYLSDIAGGGGGTTWGTITGTLSSQTDLQSALNLKAPLASPTFTGTVTIPSPFTLGATSVTSSGAELNILDGATLSTAELNFVDGVTSAIQTQLDGKVTGPGSATDNAITRYDSTTGKLVQDSSLTLSDVSGGVVSIASAGNVLRLATTGDLTDAIQLDTTSSGANIEIYPGRDLDIQSEGDISIIGNTNGEGVLFELGAQQSTGTNSGAGWLLYAGNGGPTSGDGGTLNIVGGNAVAGNSTGGAVFIGSGNSTGSDNGGDIDLQLGTVSTGTAGKLDLYQPTAGSEIFRIRNDASATVSERNFQGNLTTTSATIGTILTLPLSTIATDGLFGIEWTCLARNTAAPGTTNIYNRITKAEVVASAVSSSSTSVSTIEDAAAWDCTVLNSGGNLLFRATGAAATNIEWTVYARVMTNI